MHVVTDLEYCGHYELGSGEAVVVIKRHEGDDGQNHGVVRNQGSHLRTTVVNSLQILKISTTQTLLGKNEVNLNFLRKEARKNVPKNKQSDRKKMSGV